MKLIAAHAHSTLTEGPNGTENVLVLANSEDARTVALDGITRIDLEFPKFTDGRAFSQAFLLRRRRGFSGEIRATGEVLVDQLPQMVRSGFDAAVLKDGQSVEIAQRQLARYTAHYQGDAVQTQPLFAREAA